MWRLHTNHGIQQKENIPLPTFRVEYLTQRADTGSRTTRSHDQHLLIDSPRLRSKQHRDILYSSSRGGQAAGSSSVFGLRSWRGSVLCPRVSCALDYVNRHRSVPVQIKEFWRVSSTVLFSQGWFLHYFLFVFVREQIMTYREHPPSPPPHRPPPPPPHTHPLLPPTPPGTYHSGPKMYTRVSRTQCYLFPQTVIGMHLSDRV